MRDLVARVALAGGGASSSTSSLTAAAALRGARGLGTIAAGTVAADLDVVARAPRVVFGAGIEFCKASEGEGQ